MTETVAARAHVIDSGFPPGSLAGHDHVHARLCLLQLLAERDIPASVANDFAEIEKWLPVSRLLVTYVTGPYPDVAQTGAIERRFGGLVDSLTLRGDGVGEVAPGLVQDIRRVSHRWGQAG